MRDYVRVINFCIIISLSFSVIWKLSQKQYVNPSHVTDVVDSLLKIVTCIEHSAGSVNRKTRTEFFCYLSTPVMHWFILLNPNRYAMLLE